jgi:xanthine dehydrogenase molybdopterin-binding subunit B
MQVTHGSHPALCVVIAALGSHILGITKEMNMSTNLSRMRGGFIGRAIAVFGAAAAASAAVEGGRKPLKRDLVTLGIDPKAFDTIA